MGDREELDALRRLAELEAKAKGATEDIGFFPTFLDKLGHQAGLTTRYAAEGLASLPGIFVDPFQRLAGVKPFTQGVSEALTNIGLPQPQGNTEQAVGAISRGMASGGGTARLAAAIPATAQSIFAAAPLAQTLQAGIGGGASELTRQSGGSPLMQAAAGAVAPMAASAIPSMAMAAARGGREFIRPLTQPGQEQIAADVLGKIAQNKSQSLSNLAKFNALKELEQQTGKQIIGVQGSKPTSGAVTADYGLIGAQQMLERGTANPAFAQRYALNNQALLDELAKLKANPQQVAAYVARRDEITAPMRQAAFDNATAPVDLAPVANKIGEIIATPAGGRAESTKALRWITDRLEKYTNEGRTDPANAYALHQDIGDLVAGKVTDNNGSAIRLAGGLANQVKQELATQIDKAAPGFKKYLVTYSRLSKPIDRLEAITGRLGGEDLTRVTNATPLVSNGGGAFPLSQAKMRNAVGDLQSQLPIGPRGLPLAPYQSDILGRVMGELNSSTLASRGGKMPGSDTYQNMATANFLSGVLGDTLAKTGAVKGASKPLQWIYGPTGAEGKINDLITNAFLDPKEMQRLLSISRTRRLSPGLMDIVNPEVGALGAGLLGSYANRPSYP